MPLTIKRVQKSQFGDRIKALVAGDPGSGKTRFASTWPEPLYAATQDAGLLAVADRNPAYVELESTADLEALRMALAKPPAEREKVLGVPVQTVVLDTIDGIQRIFIQERLASEKKAQLAIADFGWLGDQVRSLVRAFLNLDMNVLFTTHLKTDKDEETGRMYLKPALQGAMGDELPAYVDLALVIRQRSMAKIVDGNTQKATVRVGQVGGDVNIPWLKDRTGTLPTEFEMDLEKDYARIHRAMFGKQAQAQPAQPAAAQPGVQPAAAPEPSAGAEATGDQGDPSSPAAPAEEPQVTGGEAPTGEGAPTQLAEPAVQAQSGTEAGPVQGPGQDEAAAPAPVPLTESAAAEHSQPEIVPEPETPVVVEAPAPVESPATPAETEAAAPAAEASGDEEDLPACTSCGKQVENEDQRDLSLLRYRKPLCKACLKAKKAA